jgi:glycerophosphoryl diester phosphodiesterase
VPTLRDALKLAGRGFGCYVEIKASNTPALKPPASAKRTRGFDRALLASLRDHEAAQLARAVIAEIRAARKSRSVVIQSFSAIVCAVVTIEAPELRVELLGSKAAEWNNYVRLASFLGLNGVNTSLETLTRSRLNQLRKAGLACAVYTVNEPTDMRRLIDWRVDGIITDRPDVARAELGRR